MDWPWRAGVSHRPEDGLEDIQLLTRPAFGAEGQLEDAGLLLGGHDLVIDASHPGTARLSFPGPVGIVGIIVCIDIDQLEIVEINRVRAEYPGAVEQIWI